MAGSAHTHDENLAAAAAHLARFAAEPLPHLIGGQPAPSVSGETFENMSPIDGARLGDVASGDAADVDAAARAAADAAQERSRLVHKPPRQQQLRSGEALDKTVES